MTKLEEIARAIGRALKDGEQLEGAARAALEAMKIPTPSMIAAGEDTGSDWEEQHNDDKSRGIDYDISGVFQAMIQAALDEKP